MKPRKSVWFALPYAKRSLDVSLWEGQEKEGKWQVSKVSLRLRKDGVDASSSEAVYMYPADALKLANVLQHYAFEALESDGLKRQEQRKQGEQQSDARSLLGVTKGADPFVR